MTRERFGATYSLAAYLTNYQMKHPDKFLQKFREVEEGIQRWVAKFKAIPPGAERARVINQELDRAVKKGLKREAAKGSAPSCHKGCSLCCHVKVDVSDDEAEAIAHWVRKTNFPVDMGRLRKQAAMVDQHHYVRELSLSDAQCIFLKDGLCAIYANRPISCRKYFVVSDPKGCDSKILDGEVLVLGLQEAEIIASAALNLSDGPPDVSLAKKLIPLLEKDHG